MAFAIPGALLAAAIVVRGLLLHAPPGVGRDLAQPLAVVTNWSAFGAILFAALLLALAAGTLAYLRFIARRPSLTLLGLTVFCALGLLAAWCVPVLFSSDAYAYAAYGEMARLGIDPYAHTVLPRGDPIFDAAVWQWGDPPPVCVYGPLFVLIARGIVTATSSLAPIAALDALRLLDSLALVLCTLLAYAAYPGDRRQRLTAAATIGLNPVLIWCAAEGHNDALALVFVLAGFALARRGATASGAAVAALAGLIKIPAAIAALAFAVRERRARAGALVGLVVTLALSLPLLLETIARLEPHGRYAPQASFAAIVKPLVLPVVHDDTAATIVASLAALAFASTIALHATRLLHRGSLEGWVALALAGWVLVPNPYPWYGVWLAAVAALASATPFARIALFLILTSLLRYAPDAIGTPSPAAAVALGIAASLPFALLLAAKSKEGFALGA